MKNRKPKANLFERDIVRTYRPDEKEIKRDAAEVQLPVNARRLAQMLERRVLSPRLASGLVRLFEIVVLGLLAIICLRNSVDGLIARLSLSALLIVVLAAMMQMTHGYEPAVLRSRRSQFLRLGASIFSATIIVGLCASLTGKLTWALTHDLWIWAIAGFGLLSVVRFFLARRMRRWVRNGFMERRAILVGGGSAAEAFIRRLEMHPDNDVRICGIFDDRSDDRSPPIVAGYPKLGSIAQLTEFARRAHIDMLIVTLPMSAQARLLSIMRELWVLPLDIRVAASSADLRFRSRSHSFLGDIPLLNAFDRPLAEWSMITKRTLDLVVGTFALIALSPVMMATAIAIKLDSPGPVFFRQKRHGFNNQIINVWKFRSLRHEMADPLARKIVTHNDPRVTRVGRFIRRSSIDELPQLFNVLTGELSLVGPRPHAVHARSSFDATFTEIVDGYFGRHKVKPGITGWAQINGWRGEIDDSEKLKKRFDYDLYYIENWSLLLDIRILVMTPISLLRSQGAY
ncbi:undecaprenyl-phosphate glucose phosphotransferase [Aureimonas ureilytica]|uniref:undecaprenyl-phosphate glucose phosphotransferase n=1 Tax=Aureimonas ureilytica TaxID=401562 RepID=UPI000734285B|nr:undecaprenyl-phosphate glucose phosphotransferase [Aureimonas ureilytica]